MVIKEKNYIIGMSNNEISKKYMEITIPEIKRTTLNEDVVLWEGITPETLPLSPLCFEKTMPTSGTTFSKELTLTEKSVWYSHYNLWKHISKNENNCWVFEHDVDLKHIFILIPPMEKQFMTARNYGSLECYYITPYAAKLLVYYAENKKINFQVDTFVNYVMKSHKKFKDISCSQNLPINQLKQFGTTIDHQPSFATSPHQE